jgi:hypothetical protein
MATEQVGLQLTAVVLKVFATGGEIWMSAENTAAGGEYESAVLLKNIFTDVQYVPVVMVKAGAEVRSISNTFPVCSIW